MIKNKKVKVENTGIIHIHTTFNNTIVTITDTKGCVICWFSPGKAGLKGARKNTAFAAQIATKEALIKASTLGIQKFHVVLNGRGNGRDSSLAVIQNEKFEILSIKDKIKLAHNGCRPPKKRRL